MKKFKINNQEIFANSLHDALEIYKHKVKDTDWDKLFKENGDDVAYSYETGGYKVPLMYRGGPEEAYDIMRDLGIKDPKKEDLKAFNISYKKWAKEYRSKAQDSKAKDEVYYEDIDSSSEAKKYAKKFGLEVEGRRAPWGGYEFAFEGSPQDLKKLVQELKRIGIEPTWSSVGDSKVKDVSWEVVRQLRCEIVCDSGEKLTIDEAKKEYGVDCNVYQCQNKATPILLANNVNETILALDKNPAKGYVLLGKARKIMADPKKRYPYYFYD